MLLQNTATLGKLILDNTSFFSEFSIHLVSISQLLSSNNFFIIFHQDSCFIMQTNTYKTIGDTKKYQRLFNLFSNNNLSVLNSYFLYSHFNNNNIDSRNLWHMKLNHPSDKILQILTSQFFDISFKFVDICHACAFGNQKCIHYPISHTKSSIFFGFFILIFEIPFLLLHLMDINIF